MIFEKLNINCFLKKTKKKNTEKPVFCFCFGTETEKQIVFRKLFSIAFNSYCRAYTASFNKI